MAIKKRPSISCITQIAVWAAAAGRCTFCNCLVLENEDLGEVVPIGELAHNVGWSQQSPRGKSPLTTEERSKPENLLLLCRNCHKPVDANGIQDRYTIEQLWQLKHEHETQVRELTGIIGSHKITIVRIVGDIRGVSPELSHQTVLVATSALRYFPQRLPGSHWVSAELDLRGLPMATSSDFMYAAQQINVFAERINHGVKIEEITRLAIFAFTRIPLLVYLGARLDDKIEMLIFQRQRIDGDNAWRWHDDSSAVSTFAFRESYKGTDPQKVALIISISGTIHADALPDGVQQTHTLYVLEPQAPAQSGATIISNQATLKNYENTIRHFIAYIEQMHHNVVNIAVFGAIPMSAAITLGRVLMPHVSPRLTIYDRNHTGSFFKALEIQR